MKIFEPITPREAPQVHQLILGGLTVGQLPELKKPWDTVAVGVDHDRLGIHSQETHKVMLTHSARAKFNTMGPGYRTHYVPREMLPERARSAVQAKPGG